MRITLVLATAKELQLQSEKKDMAADIITMMILQYRCLFLRERIFINSPRLTPKLNFISQAQYYTFELTLRPAEIPFPRKKYLDSHDYDENYT